MVGESNWRRFGGAVFVIAAVLLVSYGGAIVAAPVTLPLMFVAVRRHPTTGFRVAWRCSKYRDYTGDAGLTGFMALLQHTRPM